MKKFLLRLVIVISIVLIIDRALALIVDKFYKTATTTDEYKLNFVTYKMNAQVVFMGSSRCHHHYVPKILEDSLKKSVYNAGLWGMRNIYFQYGLLNNILERYTPQTIFLEIHPIDFLKTPYSDLTSVSNLSPFINQSTGVNDVLKEGKYFYKDELSHIYRYNSLLPNLILGNIFNRSNENDKGLKPLYGELNISNGILTPERFNFPVDLNRVRYLQAFIDKCKDKKITLVFLFSPMYAVDNINYLQTLEALAKKNKIDFLNYYKLEGITGKKEYFYDFGHLNIAGAQRYSAMIAPKLKKYIR
ncbi:MAG: hypothetical protein EOO93_02610 [Pedobacter sp.]|uniref:hypothetical protein n=1 Tax=Pedobacter agri TaxID=454586 RepID=UPI0012233B2F|nr:hypothetical protein [Pedobacter agri]RZL69061.1 MAG: hypothetical protein EOO93_02610 [Pedobacter sp.]